MNYYFIGLLLILITFICDIITKPQEYYITLSGATIMHGCVSVCMGV